MITVDRLVIGSGHNVSPIRGTPISHPVMEPVDEKQWDAIITTGVELADLYGFAHKDGNPLTAVSITLNGHETASILDGTFSILGIEPGYYTITCTKEGYKDYSKSITLTTGRNDIDIKMLSEEVEVANLYAFVHDTDGNPLAAVSITLNGYETASMLDGTFSILVIEPGEYTVTCTKEGYKDYSKTISLGAGDNEADIEMLREEEEEESWWEKLKDWWAGLETWQQALIIGGGASGAIALVALATGEKGKGE